jgi:hypothetical protein
VTALEPEAGPPVALDWLAIGAPVDTAPPGEPGDVLEFGHRHEQTIAAAVWNVFHPLSFTPAGVHVIESTGEPLLGVVTYPAAGHVRIEFSAPCSGVAYLS